MITSFGGCSRPPAELQFHMLCMNCSPTAFDGGARGRLDVLQAGKTPPRKRDGWLYPEGRCLNSWSCSSAARNIPTLVILGAQFVCSDSVISICSSSKFISVVSDMDAFCLCVNPFSVGSRNTGVLLFSFSSVHVVEAGFLFYGCQIWHPEQCTLNTSLLPLEETDHTWRHLCLRH